jgi:hypothetical protein
MMGTLCRHRTTSPDPGGVAKVCFRAGSRCLVVADCVEKLCSGTQAIYGLWSLRVACSACSGSTPLAGAQRVFFNRIGQVRTLLLTKASGLGRDCSGWGTLDLSGGVGDLVIRGG